MNECREQNDRCSELIHQFFVNGEVLDGIVARNRCLSSFIKLLTHCYYNKQMRS